MEARGTSSHESIRVKRSREESVEAGERDKHRFSKEKRKKTRHPLSEINKVDPIMLEPVRHDAFLFIRPNGTLVAFNIESLVDYLLATGEFYDPETRIPFSENDLKRIDMYAKASGLSKTSVYEAKLNATRLYADARFRRDALLGEHRVFQPAQNSVVYNIPPTHYSLCYIIYLSFSGLERCAGELINEIMSIIEEGDDDAELQLLLRGEDTDQTQNVYIHR